MYLCTQRIDPRLIHIPPPNAMLRILHAFSPSLGCSRQQKDADACSPLFGIHSRLPTTLPIYCWLPRNLPYTTCKFFTILLPPFEHAYTDADNGMDYLPPACRLLPACYTCCLLPRWLRAPATPRCLALPPLPPLLPLLLCSGAHCHCLRVHTCLRCPPHTTPAAFLHTAHGSLTCLPGTFVPPPHCSHPFLHPTLPPHTTPPPLDCIL